MTNVSFVRMSPCLHLPIAVCCFGVLGSPLLYPVVVVVVVRIVVVNRLVVVTRGVRKNRPSWG